MTTPAHQSTAEAVLAEMTAATEEAATEDQLASAEDADMSGEVEVEEKAPGEPTRRRSLSWEDAIKAVPPDIAKLMKQMQGDYTRKTQELAEQRRDFIREREALLKGSATLKTDGELPEYDPFNEQSIQARIEQEVSRRLRDVLEPMEAEYRAMAAEDDYQSFLTAHPDFKDDQGLRSEVQHLLEQNQSLDLETAYWAAKGKQSRIQKEADRKVSRARKEAQRQAAGVVAPPRKGGNPVRPTAKDLKNMSAADILAAAKALTRQ